jgi:hypothetical protein
MKPRNYWVTFLLYGLFSGVAFILLFAIIFSGVSGVDFFYLLEHFWWGGLIFGLLFGAIIAALLRQIVITLPFHTLPDFQARLQYAMSQIGYRLSLQSGNMLTFKPEFRAGLLAGSITVQLLQDTAAILGPWQYMRRLPKLMGYQP